MTKSISEIKLGILGGGQLGRMLIQAAKEWNLDCHIMDESEEFPSGNVGANFTLGNFKDYDDVYNFGKDLDILTVEIEHVNIDALFRLQAEGVQIHPNPDSLLVIKDKGLQKNFYHENGFPTAPFKLFQNKTEIVEALNSGIILYPFVQKSRLAGYDGKGVVVIRSESQLNDMMDVPSVIEEMIEIQTEISVIASRNNNNEIRCYPVVDMDFHNKANLVEFVYYPSTLSDEIQENARVIATKLIESLHICGLLAVEMFVDNNSNIIINEIAPRPHNSGHLTIEASLTSQFQQHLRGVCNLPLGETRFHSPAVMVNLLGAEGFNGPTKYDGIHECLAVNGASVHLYGKQTTKSFRKMGHATVLDKTRNNATFKAQKIKQLLKIYSK